MGFWRLMVLTWLSPQHQYWSTTVCLCIKLSHIHMNIPLRNYEWLRFHDIFPGPYQDYVITEELMVNSPCVSGVPVGSADERQTRRLNDSHIYPNVTGHNTNVTTNHWVWWNSNIFTDFLIMNNCRIYPTITWRYTPQDFIEDCDVIFATSINIDIYSTINKCTYLQVVRYRNPANKCKSLRFHEHDGMDRFEGW